MGYLNLAVAQAAQNAGAKSGHGIPVGWIGFGALMVILLFVGVRWARRHNRRG